MKLQTPLTALIALGILGVFTGLGCGSDTPSGKTSAGTSSSSGGATAGVGASTGIIGGGSSGASSGSPGSTSSGSSASNGSSGSNGVSTVGTTGSTGSTSTSQGSTGATTGGTSGDCAPDGNYVGAAGDCCSGMVDCAGYCSASACAGGTTNGSTTGATCSPNGTFAYQDGDCCSGTRDCGGYCNQTGCTQTTTTTTGTTGATTGGASCSSECLHARGYHCDNGQCVLNGATGQVRVTLNWTNSPRAREDLDLHVIEPGGCEIYYGHRNCVGSLDLDSNAACANTDNPGSFGNDTENVIYPTTGAPSGSYLVRVTDYEDECDSSGADPFTYTVTVQVNGTTLPVYTGSFHQGDSRGGGAGSGVSTISFTVP